LDLGFGDELYSLFKPNFGTKGVGFFKIEATGVKDFGACANISSTILTLFLGPPN